jgi:hypothetical protein
MGHMVSIFDRKSVLVQDGFNRANIVSSTSLGKADTGQTWEIMAGTFEINNGVVYARSAGLNIAQVDTSITSYRVSTDVSADAYLGVGFRIVDSANHYTCRYTGGGLEIYKLLAGTPTLIGSFSKAISGVRNVMIETNGSTIKAYLNGELLLTVSDNSLPNTTKAGIRSSGDTGTIYLDNFRVEEI